MSAPLPVLVDIGPAVHQRAGLSRYTSSLVAAIAQHCRDEVDLRLFYNRHRGHQPPPVLRTLPSASLPLGQYTWRLSVLASRLLRLPYAPLRRSLAGRRVYHACEHLLPYLTLPTVLTVHDLIFEHYPQHHTWANRTFLRLAMPLFARGATRIIAVSHATSGDLQRIYGIDPAKIEVIHEGVDPLFQPPAADLVAQVRAKYSPDRPYFLMVGTLEPRKNHTLAMHALARLKTQGYPHRLLVTGAEGWLFEPIRQAVRTLGLENDVTFTGHVPGADLPGLFAAATAFLMPSLYEGFGLPVLEAMACGAPVISSNASSLPELCGDAALMVAPTDLDAFVAAQERLITQPELAADLRRRGLQRASHFRWEHAAKATAATYRAAAGET